LINNNNFLIVRYGNLTEEDSDAIVNAANENLQHGGGVAAALVRAGGYSIQQDSDDYIEKHGPLRVTEVIRTSQGSLNCKVLLHAVGPVWSEHNKEKSMELLKKTIRRFIFIYFNF